MCPIVSEAHVVCEEDEYVWVNWRSSRKVSVAANVVRKKAVVGRERVYLQIPDWFIFYTRSVCCSNHHFLQ